MGHHSLHVPGQRPTDNHVPDSRVKVPSTLLLLCQHSYGDFVRNHSVLHVQRHPGCRGAKNVYKLRSATVVFQHSDFCDGGDRSGDACGEQHEAPAEFPGMSGGLECSNGYCDYPVYHHRVLWVSEVRR